MGIPTASERLALTGRVRDYLKDQDILLEKLSPKVLLEKTFSKDDKQKNFTEIWESFLKYAELPMLESENVLKNAIVQGVQNGIFGIAIGEKVRYLETVSTEELTEDVVVLRKEIAQEMKKEVEGIPIVVKPGVPVEVAPEIKPVPKVGMIRRIKITTKVPWDKLSEMVRGVFAPLNREGAQITLEVKIDAQSEKGISRDTLDLKIKETLNQIGAKVIEEEVE